MIGEQRCFELKVAPWSITRAEADELLAAYALVRKLSQMKLCDDAGEGSKCYLDSGPRCGRHFECVEDQVEAARKLLEVKP